jgi:UDP-N-acetylglucosamine 4,6-dehydratase
MGMCRNDDLLGSIEDHGFEVTPSGRLKPKVDPATEIQSPREKKTVLITGGAGSLGRTLALYYAGTGHTVRVLDINEGDLAALDHPGVRKLYGSICSPDRLALAMKGADICIHAAAMKNLDIAEYNVEDLVATNIQGTLNVARAAMDAGVPVSIFISSDKAVEPTTAYGASKQMGERIWLWANRVSKTARFMIFRSGNFEQSKGNVFEVWKRQAAAGGPLTITHPEMKRYFIRIDRAAELIAGMPDQARGGDIVIPYMVEQQIGDLARTTFPGVEIRRTGLRPGEKMAERLMTDDERRVAVDGSYWYRIPGPQRPGDLPRKLPRVDDKELVI